MHFKMGGGFKIAGSNPAAKCKNKGRDKIESYFEHAKDPQIEDNGDGTITLHFKPMSNLLATYLVESKSVYFGIIIVNSGNRLSDHKSKYRKTRRGNHGRKPGQFSRYFRANFLDSYNPINCGNLFLICDNSFKDTFGCKVTIAELMSGEITRNIDWLYNIDYQNTGYHEDWEEEFWIGLYYRDTDNIPQLFKMADYLIYPGIED